MCDDRTDISKVEAVELKTTGSQDEKRRQTEVFCKTQLIPLSVCQAELIWPGLHRDKVLVMNLSKRIQGTWYSGSGGGGEVEKNKRVKEEGGGAHGHQ